MADALLNKTVHVAELCSTGPEIKVNGWVVLEDDKGTQPADHIAPIVRNDLLAKIDRAKFEQTLNNVSSKIDTATLAQLYYDVAVDHKDIAAVASAWLPVGGHRHRLTRRSSRCEPRPRRRRGLVIRRRSSIYAGSVDSGRTPPPSRLDL